MICLRTTEILLKHVSANEDRMNKSTKWYAFLLMVTALLMVSSDRVRAQGQTQWIQIGSLRNWYSEKGWEIEVGRTSSADQQDGLQWPQQYNRQDCQAAKGFWIGVKNFTDQNSVAWETKVVHVGPRTNGDNEFFPKAFNLYAQFDPPMVTVDGILSVSTPENIAAVTDTLKADRELITKVNTAIGLTMERRIYAFSQQFHDNYHIFEFIFTNTGNPDLGLPAKTLTGLQFYWQYRYAAVDEVRYEVANSSSWGINTMNDMRGYPPDIANSLIPASENDIKCMFAWHGLHTAANKPTSGSPNVATFDNIGAPIFNPSISSGFIQAADTNWRLGAPQFMGDVHIYADKSASDRTAATDQPSTTNFLDSDNGPLTHGQSALNLALCQAEYAKMTEGHMPRHAWLVQPDGKFDQQTQMANIGAGASGGFEECDGYGPYTLAPGQSLRIVFAEGVDGLTRDECKRIGKMYKDGTINTKAKDDSVLSGHLRLLDTFRRAIANYNSGFNIPRPPYPPATFNVRGGGDRISLSWDPNPKESANGFVGYRLYRATGRFDSTFHLIYQCGGPAPTDPNVKYAAAKNYSFDDVTPTRGVDYYYYISSFGNAIAADPTTRTPAGVLESSRFYTQTYNATNLKRQAGTSSDQIRIAPNPYVISSSESRLRFPNEPNRIAFFNIPGNCVIKIYTELGELIKEIIHNDGTGDAYWDSTTSSNQFIVSGIYIVVIENKDTGEKTIKKLVAIR